MPTKPLDLLLDAIIEPSAAARAKATVRQANLTKPPGSLGALESIGIQLSAIADTCPPPIPTPATVAVFAGDHGVCAQGITPWPQEITVAMVSNMAAGGAAINVLARQVGATVVLTDVGVQGDYPPADAIINRNVARGTNDLSVESAMTKEQAIEALLIGASTAEDAVSAGSRVLLTGEMGIGNTTASAALIAVFTGADVAAVTGRGAGADDDALARKIQVIQTALNLHQPSAANPVETLSAVGGFEQAALAGFILGAAKNRVPVILDGVIASAAACVAVALAPAAKGYLIAGHAGAEPGIAEALRHLGLAPLVDLGLRLGEGTGAALALPMVQAAARIMAEMATFADAGIEH